MAPANAAPASFLWHDYETFGADPRRDRPAQFAAIRTDAELNEIGEPIELYCRPSDDALPHPAACLITGITPQKARRHGVPETEFAGRIQAVMSEPGTCVVGYNSLRFDDEVSRNLFYRNFLDPYAREWQNGNSRWDLIDVVRAFYALRPDGITWPEREDGAPSFKLEALTAANGIEHAGAHDALADVRATIALARLLRDRNPKLFDYLLGLRGKRAVAQKLDVASAKPVLHISRRYPASRGCSALVMPLAEHPTNPNGVIVFDLGADPAELLSLGVEQIRERVFVSQQDLAEGESRIPLKVIHINRCPVVFPASALKDVQGPKQGEYGEIQARLGIDVDQCRAHWKTLRDSAAQVAQKVAEVFGAGYEEGPQDPDLMLYSGNFFSPADRQQMQRVRETSPWDLVGARFAFQDPRLEEMLFRFRARNYPETLEGEEREQWEAFRWARLNDAAVSGFTLKAFAREIERYNQQSLSDYQRQILEEVVMFVEAMLPAQAFDA
ncbi:MULTISPECIES: exodeoxyribonuclease I [unclassified Halomonas]|uniref:exodeoxyribonuclease I n=1 Tax=unclassified Halomonas TaxID=2609666 RepID=UPI00209ED27F|nr:MULTISPECIES: exodeoxyribonuclease I [unclassified Halomonas]MCP1314558.1 exodeoxyribonuclease I [Halomonas sp. 707D7]MCP1327185.1 exodeoxyribonuclease I [Halomonas sp. 707D4]